MREKTRNNIISVTAAFLGTTGLIFNITIILMYIRRKRLKFMERKTYSSCVDMPSLVVVRAVIDIIVCGFDIPLTAICIVWKYFLKSELLCKSFVISEAINIPLTAILLPIIAFERFTTIFKPQNTVLKSIKFKIIVLFLMSFAIFFGSIAGFYHSVFMYRENIDYSNAYYLIQSFISSGILPLESVEKLEEDLVNGTSEKIYVGVCTETNHPFFSASIKDAYVIMNSSIFYLCFLITVVFYVKAYLRISEHWKHRHDARERMRHILRVNRRRRRTRRSAREGGSQGQDFPSIQPTATSDIKTGASACSQTVTCYEVSAVASRQIRTAIMLFFSSLVFAVTVFPPTLMSLGVVPFNEILFRFYLINNVIQLPLYGISNSLFRAELYQFCNYVIDVICLRRDKRKKSQCISCSSKSKYATCPSPKGARHRRSLTDVTIPLVGVKPQTLSSQTRSSYIGQYVDNNNELAINNTGNMLGRPRSKSDFGPSEIYPLVKAISSKPRSRCLRKPESARNSSYGHAVNSGEINEGIQKEMGQHEP